MKKNLLIAILLIAVFVISIFIGYFINLSRKNTERKYLAETLLAQNSLNDVITTSKVENVISPNSQQLEEKVDNNIKYMLKEYEGCIAVYRVEDDDKLILEDTTDILTKYLSEEDLRQLKNGITVTGLNELTHLLEDFE